MIKVFSTLGIIISLFTFKSNVLISSIILGISIISAVIMYFLDIINFVIFKESNVQGAIYSHKKFSKDINGVTLSFYKILLEILFLPYEAYQNLDASIRSICRMVKKKRLLEWVTAEDRR